MKIIKTYANKLVKYLKKVKDEHLINEYIKSNPIFIVFVVTCLINSTMLRFFTMTTIDNYLSIKAILADLTVLIIFGAFGFLFKSKNRFWYYLCLEIFFTAICMINSIYYTFYTSFASASMLSLTQFIGPVGDAVVENVFQIKDTLYLLGPIVLIVTYIKNRSKRNKIVQLKKERKKKAFKTLIFGFVLAIIFLISLSPLEIGRFAKQWNREYIVMKFGIYLYQFNDVVASLQPKINSMFGYDNAKRTFTEYFKDKEISKENEYTNIFEGKNVLVIHAESIQTVAMNRSFNGVDVTPTLNRLASEGMLFSNFYSQVSVGTSSDAELTFNTSLMPTQSGTAFVSYFDRKYIAIPQLLKDKGYYTFSMHANNADFWNRRVMHENLGYDKFYSKSNYKVTKENSIGLGLSDEDFFKQSVPIIKRISEKHTPFYGLSIMLTNHTPFSETERYGEYPVNIKETITNDQGIEEEVIYDYMENTKLGNYFKSVHYADRQIGAFLEQLDQEGLLDNMVVVIYGDHDARLPREDYNRLYNYDKLNNSILDKDDPDYKEFDHYQYELNRKVPFIIWTKDKKYQKEVKNVMGMYDVMPTLGNMLGIKNEYALGHDIFDIKESNVVVFPNGNWVTNKIYYNNQKGEYLSLDGEAISEEYISEKNNYAEKLLDVSNNIIVFDLLKKGK